MPYAIITTTNARRDVQDAIEWENKRKPGLAKRFLEDVDQKLLITSKFPYNNRVRYEDVRCAITKVFPYLIHYIIDESQQQITILRVLHTSREPVW